MCIKPAAVILLGALVASAGLGCKRSAAAPEQSVAVKPPAPPPPVYRNLASIHWAGKSRLSGDTNSSKLMAICALPESTKLQANVLDKLAAAPGRLSCVAANAETNAAAALLRPLFEDLFEEETWLEVRQLTNKPAEVGLALHVDETHAALWQSNLASGLEKLFGSAPVQSTNGWVLQTPGSSNVIELARTGDWILVGFSGQQSPLLREFSDRIRSRRSPVSLEGSNEWLHAEVDLAGLGVLIAPGRIPPAFPRVTLAFSNEGENVRTRAELVFPGPLRFQLDDWQVPTNVIQQPLIGFSAIRGFGPWLSELPWWRELQATPAPNQAFIWSLQAKMPFLTYVVAPLATASNTVASFCQHIVTGANPWMRTNAYGQLAASTNLDEVSWVDIPVVNPFAKLLKTDDGDYAVAGLIGAPVQRTTFPVPLLDELSRHTNLVFYDWELTGDRFDAVLSSSQILRFLFRKPQLANDSVELRWWKTIGPNLGNCATAVTQTAPERLSLKRKSSIGLSSIELQLLCDWLASPDFPTGLHTTRAPLPALLRRVKPAALPGPQAPLTNAAQPRR